MAEEDRPHLRLTREQKVANLLARRHNLSPPVDVRALAEHYADIQVDNIPVNCDAIAIHSPVGSARPLIILDATRGRNQGRQRFTLSHEIGHIVIPWHAGTVACHVDEATVRVDEEHYWIEAEANVFASELLMPTSWVDAVINSSTSLENLVTWVVNGANVSHAAARIKLLDRLPRGYACLEIELSPIR